jgi:hypothetical protein
MDHANENLGRVAGSERNSSRKRVALRPGGTDVANMLAFIREGW